MKNYEELVYAGVLGKVIGVYMGRPFEGWPKASIEKRWGMISGYVHEDMGKPLVVADDDITGTFTFVRALEDSGLYQETPEAFYGDNWLNYILENKTILWWGGMGLSTEHTAFLRLKEGIPAPQSGSIARNGHTVAEQIGAQIFIDAFGMVAPGRPELAADMARKAARVSHDGEAVHAAVVVAAMVSAAFTEKKMSRLLDIGVAQIPGNSLLAAVHRDVRAWCRADGDWHKTFERIDRKYGYKKYGGNCHVIPNHAIMVMAWCYAPDDFYESQRIINTAGWDTDCNAANVGSVMGIKVGLAGINARHEFQAPFADRVLLPTAEGSNSTSDCLLEALRIARMGRVVMGWSALPPAKKGAWHHFEQPGARHGYQPESSAYACRDTARVSNVAGHSALGRRSLRVSFDVDAGRQARISTPVLARSDVGGYGIVATPQLYSGMLVRMEGAAGALDAAVSVRLFVRHLTGGKWSETAVAYGPSADLKSGRPFVLRLTVPDTHGCAVIDLGIEVRAAGAAQGELFVDCVRSSGKPAISFPSQLPRDGDAPGWIRHAEHLGGSFSDDPEDFTHAGRNAERGLLVTGNKEWRDYTFEARIKVHLADMGGLLVRYQGLQRYIALVRTSGNRLQLVRRYYGDTVLGEVPCQWKLDQPHDLKLVCKGALIQAFCDGRKILEGRDDLLRCGGAGLVFEKGMIGFNRVRVS